IDEDSCAGSEASHGGVEINRARAAEVCAGTASRGDGASEQIRVIPNGNASAAATATEIVGRATIRGNSSRAGKFCDRKPHRTAGPATAVKIGRIDSAV